MSMDTTSLGYLIPTLNSKPGTLFEYDLHGTFCIFRMSPHGSNAPLGWQLQNAEEVHLQASEHEHLSYW